MSQITPIQQFKNHFLTTFTVIDDPDNVDIATVYKTPYNAIAELTKFDGTITLVGVELVRKGRYRRGQIDNYEFVGNMVSHCVYEAFPESACVKSTVVNVRHLISPESADMLHYLRLSKRQPTSPISIYLQQGISLIPNTTFTEENVRNSMVTLAHVTFNLDDVVYKCGVMAGYPNMHSDLVGRHLAGLVVSRLKTIGARGIVFKR